jgi:hypothetical protein
MKMAYIRKLSSGRWQCQVRLTGLKSISRTFKTKALATAFGRKVEGDTELARKLGAPTTQCPTVGELVTDYLGAITLRDPVYGELLFKLPRVTGIARGNEISTGIG